MPQFEELKLSNYETLTIVSSPRTAFHLQTNLWTRHTLFMLFTFTTFCHFLGFSVTSEKLTLKNYEYGEVRMNI